MKTPSNPGLRRTYVNPKKANRDRYKQEVGAALSKRSLPTDCQRDEKIFRTVLLKAASHHIPTGRHRLHEEHVPAEILDVMNRRDDLRKRDPTSPKLSRLNKDIQNRICVHKRQKWRDFVETMDQQTDLTRLRKTIKVIDGRAKRETENEAIIYNGSCCCLPTPLTLASGWGESDLPACGPPVSFSVHLASSAVSPSGSVHKSRGDNVVRMWVQLKRGCVLCI